jgi:hypothetical protein
MKKGLIITSIVESMIVETLILKEENDIRLITNNILFHSTDSGWDNPFRPDGDLSREADEIVNLIKGFVKSHSLINVLSLIICLFRWKTNNTNKRSSIIERKSYEWKS